MSYIDEAYPDIVRDRPLWIRSTYLADACSEVDRLRASLATARADAEQMKEQISDLQRRLSDANIGHALDDNGY